MEILLEQAGSIVRILLEYCGNTLGILWATFGASGYLQGVVWVPFGEHLDDFLVIFRRKVESESAAAGSIELMVRRVREGLEIAYFRFFQVSFSRRVFMTFFITFLQIFVDFRVPLGGPLASKSLPGEGKQATRIRYRFQGGSRASFLIDFGGISRWFWEPFLMINRC